MKNGRAVGALRRRFRGQVVVPGDPGYYVFRQIIYVVGGVVLLAAAAVIDPHAYRRVRWPLNTKSASCILPEISSTS